MRTGRSLTVCCSLLPGGGGCLSGLGGVCLVWGGLSLVRGGSPWSGGVLPGPGGSPWSGGVLPGPGGVLPGPWGFSVDPPVNRITDTCKNITLATTSLRPVMT